MCPLRRVEDSQAGPQALGILVPPGRRTIVIVRPRALIWDLVLMRADNAATGLPFEDLSQKEAAATAENLFGALENWYSGGPGGMQTACWPNGESHWVKAELGSFTLAACLRIPGQPYRPMQFKKMEEAGEAADALATVLFPAINCDQEVYFNTRHFAR
jgi:hypothetical protein